AGYFHALKTCLDLPGEEEMIFKRLMSQPELVPTGVRDPLRTLKLDGATIRACETGCALFRQGLPEDDAGWRRALAAYGTDGCRVGAAMAGKTVLLQLEAVLAQNPCVRVGQLDLSGGELARMGLQGARIGAAQRFLLEHVLGKPEDNRAEVLVLKLEEFLARS
ncbi:MAG: hypothetical protein IKB79_06440, partial [Oscillospiraceae bacterium]|nr:hypothetical protein [Oscillospiraceae bacterium]